MSFITKNRGVIPHQSQCKSMYTNEECRFSINERPCFTKFKYFAGNSYAIQYYSRPPNCFTINRL